MSKVDRMCVQCGEGNPIEARYCARCGYDSQAALPVQHSNLPAVIGRAALPVLVGAAGLAVRAGWKLLQSRLAQASTPSVVNVPAQPFAPPPSLPQILTQQQTNLAANRRAKRTVHIRSAWSVNNGDGVWQQGTSEQTIEFED
jgi:hypothetical protein